MSKPVLGQTTFEQMPEGYKTGVHRHTHKPWALIIVCVIVIVFGLFWLSERPRAVVIPHPVSVTRAPSPQALILPVPQSPPSDTVAELRNAVINTPLADYSGLF